MSSLRELVARERAARGPSSARLAADQALHHLGLTLLHEEGSAVRQSGRGEEEGQEAAAGADPLGTGVARAFALQRAIERETKRLQAHTHLLAEQLHGWQGGLEAMHQALLELGDVGALLERLEAEAEAVAVAAARIASRPSGPPSTPPAPL